MYNIFYYVINGLYPVIRLIQTSLIQVLFTATGAITGQCSNSHEPSLTQSSYDSEWDDCIVQATDLQYIGNKYKMTFVQHKFLWYTY